MKERYPFFRDETEHSLAVIGESGIWSDLNGQFEKPYAVLTQKRLYCKNERGNFIVETAQLTNAGEKAALPMPTIGWVTLGLAFLVSVLWTVLLNSGMLRFQFNNDKDRAFLLFFSVLAIFSLSLIWLRKRPKVTLAFLMGNSLLSFLNIQSVLRTTVGGQIHISREGDMIVNIIRALGVLNFVLGAVGLALYIKSESDIIYEIKHSTGIFFFKANAYPKEELTAFSKAVADLKGTNV